MSITNQRIFRKFVPYNEKYQAKDMKTSVILRFVALGALWLLVVWALVASTERITLYTVFVIVASAIIVFMPMYKKYIKNPNERGR